MSKHTPGPWAVQPSDERTHTELAEVWGGWSIVAPIDRETDMWEDKANADLMAAAPKLLAAWETFLQATQQEDLEMAEAAIEMGRAAVAELGILYLLPEPASAPTDPMHQLAAAPLYDPSRDKTTPLADLMRQKHEAGECGALGCPECKAEQEGQELYEAACPEAEPIRQTEYETVPDLWAVTCCGHTRHLLKERLCPVCDKPLSIGGGRFA